MEEIHLFQKKLKKSHIEKDLSFPTETLKILQVPQEVHRIPFETVDATGTLWPFEISTRLTGRYRKPVLLRSSWHPFVAHKGLMVGDRVMFYVLFLDDEPNEWRLRVRAQRSIMTLFGKECWVDVENLQLYGL